MFPTATPSRPPGRPIPPPGGKTTFVLDGAAVDAAPGPEPWRSRPLTSPRCRPSRNVAHHAFNDPSNYLG
jgi:hypothetical protein